MSRLTPRNESQMKKIKTRRLIDSKWTDLAPAQQDKHFVVTRVEVGKTTSSDTDSVELRALISKRTRMVTLDQLSDETLWLPDWR
jgi:tryptophan-rich hypothetical protein